MWLLGVSASGWEGNFLPQCSQVPGSADVIVWQMRFADKAGIVLVNGLQLVMPPAGGCLSGSLSRHGMVMLFWEVAVLLLLRLVPCC